MRRRAPEDFAFDALLERARECVASVPPTRAGLAKALVGARARLETRPATPRDPWEDLGASKVHAPARELLADPFFSDPTNDLAPVGNDTGADVLAAYERWRGHPLRMGDAP